MAPFECGLGALDPPGILAERSNSDPPGGALGGLKDSQLPPRQQEHVAPGTSYNAFPLTLNCHKTNDFQPMHGPFFDRGLLRRSLPRTGVLRCGAWSACSDGNPRDVSPCPNRWGRTKTARTLRNRWITFGQDDNVAENASPAEGMICSVGRESPNYELDKRRSDSLCSRRRAKQVGCRGTCRVRSDRGTRATARAGAWSTLLGSKCCSRHATHPAVPKR